MRSDLMTLHLELSRRSALRLGAAGAVAAGLAASRTPADATAAVAPGDVARESNRHYDDTMFDYEAVLTKGAWTPGPYGKDDRRGTFNELTPQHTADALAILRRDRPVMCYQLGDRMFNGYPAFDVTPPRAHQMRLVVNGYTPPSDFVQNGGLLGSTEPLGPNKVSAHEERFAQNYTFQIGTQVDGLGHIGVGDRFYNGLRGAHLADANGLKELGNETMGPVVTRAVIYDVVGLKVAEGASGDLSVAPNGSPILRDDYRVTAEDLRRCLDRQRTRPVGKGDIPIVYTGWSHLAADAPTRYLTQEPGIYLAEARAFAETRVALIASDNWALEVLTPAVTHGYPFACHQELIGKYGVRIGEGWVPQAAIADHVYEGVVVVTPQNVPGATAGSTPPVLMGQPGRPPRP